ncbi:uncharacterized protein FFFS_13893 [Fusarium fujikuroi]|nr:uncharacterized protein FFFS_13893 [Fusarium fujikuroi]
MHIPGEEPVV